MKFVAGTWKIVHLGVIEETVLGRWHDRPTGRFSCGGRLVDAIDDFIITVLFGGPRSVRVRGDATFRTVRQSTLCLGRALLAILSLVENNLRTHGHFDCDVLLNLSPRDI